MWDWEPQESSHDDSDEVEDITDSFGDASEPDYYPEEGSGGESQPTRTRSTGLLSRLFRRGRGSNEGLASRSSSSSLRAPARHSVDLHSQNLRRETQQTIPNMMGGGSSSREYTCGKITSMFYENAIPFNVASLQSYHKAFNSVRNYAHVIDFVLEDLESFCWLKDTIEDVRKISKFVYAHAWVLAKFRGHLNRYDLIRPSQTWFATSFIAIRSIMENQVHLQQLFVDTEYRKSNYAKLSTSKAAQKIVISDHFWKKTRSVVAMVEPLSKVLRLVDSDKPTMGYLFDALCTLRAVITTFLGPRRSANVFKIFDHRWKEQLHSDLHAAGYILNPYYMFFPSTFSNENVMCHPTLALNNLIVKTISTPLEQAQVMLEKLNDLVFVQYNIRFERRREDRRRRYCVDLISVSAVLLEDPLCEWIAKDDDEPLLPTHNEWPEELER
ncbi:hypothetical protein GIB67_021143 [Kingdonia uniflora]|uniref:Uncharacterized protein n=1 Tax=Kingdonia uniflora TaxID=39325 RepID=A0A7J7N7J4_9MAGN|nr:hypothetical protein GIB67_021143 [Kingdonia uniflora]